MNDGSIQSLDNEDAWNETEMNKLNCIPRISMQGIYVCAKGISREIRLEGSLNSLRRRLAPIFIDSILQLNDSKISDLNRKSVVQVCALQMLVIARTLLPLLQLFGASLYLIRI